MSDYFCGRIRPEGRLGERHYVTLASWLSVVCNVRARPTHSAELFRNIFAPSNSLGTRVVCVKFWENFKWVLGDCAS